MSSIRSVVLASGNVGKLRELRELLRKQIRLIDMRELGLVAAEETGSSFEENARLKAFAAAEQSGLPALSDDSGLEVDALGGAPGIYSSRYAGDDGNARSNIRKLLMDLEGVPAANRTARFRCVLVLAMPDRQPAPLIAEGVWEGPHSREGRRTPGIWLRSCIPGRGHGQVRGADERRGKGTQKPSRAGGS